MWVAESDEECNECKTCFERAKEGFVRLLGEGSPKAVNVAYSITSQLPTDDERIMEYKRLWERAKGSLPNEAVKYDIATSMACKFSQMGEYEEAKVLFLADLEGRRRVLGEEHKDTLASLSNLGNVLDNMEDYEGALDYYQQAWGARGGVGEDTSSTHHEHGDHIQGRIEGLPKDRGDVQDRSGRL